MTAPQPPDHTDNVLLALYHRIPTPIQFILKSLVALVFAISLPVIVGAIIASYFSPLSIHALPAQLRDVLISLGRVITVMGELVGVYLWFSYQRERTTIKELMAVKQTLTDGLASIQMENIEAIKALKLEGLRMIPYGDVEKSKRMFFHVDVWEHGISTPDKPCDLTVDIIFEGPTFQARNYILSPTYLSYFFDRLSLTMHSRIPDSLFNRLHPAHSPLFKRRATKSDGEKKKRRAKPFKAIRIILVDRVDGTESSRHDQDLLVYLNISALAGYATFAVPKAIYRQALTKIEKELAPGVSSVEVRQFFEGHLGLTASYMDGKLHAETAFYDTFNDIEEERIGEVKSLHMRQILLDMALNFLCWGDARIPKEGVELHDIASGLLSLRSNANRWPYEKRWAVELQHSEQQQMA